MLAGHSFGGLYVQAFAANYPDQVAGLVLLDSTAPKPGLPPQTRTESDSVLRRVSAVFSAVAHLGCRTADRAGLLRQSPATRPARGARQRLNRPLPPQLDRGVRRGEHLDAAGGVADQPRR